MRCRSCTNGVSGRSKLWSASATCGDVPISLSGASRGALTGNFSRMPPILERPRPTRAKPPPAWHFPNSLDLPLQPVFLSFYALLITQFATMSTVFRGFQCFLVFYRCRGQLSSAGWRSYPKPERVAYVCERGGQFAPGLVVTHLLAERSEFEFGQRAPFALVHRYSLLARCDYF